MGPLIRSVLHNHCWVWQWKNFEKSVNICRSYGQESSVLFFFDSRGINVLILMLWNLTPSQFDCTRLSFVLPALTDSDKKAITAWYTDNILVGMFCSNMAAETANMPLYRCAMRGCFSLSLSSFSVHYGLVYDLILYGVIVFLVKFIFVVFLLRLSVIYFVNKDY